jgi:hypothetical protein
LKSIAIPTEFRDRWFSQNFAKEIQTVLLSDDSEVVIDFSNCNWVDPTPLLALLAHLHAWNRRSVLKQLKPRLYVSLGSADASSTSGSRSVRYLAEHGFLIALSEACPLIELTYESSLPGYPIKFYAQNLPRLFEAIRESNNIRLYYGSDAALKPHCFWSDCNQSELTATIDDLVQQVDDNLFRGRRSEFTHRDSALVRFRQIALEIVGNACEHAYSDGIGPVLLYARLRKHNDHVPLTPLTPNERDVESQNAAPLIHQIHEVSGDRYLEFFVCDVGKGIAADVGLWKINTSNSQVRSELETHTALEIRFPLRKLLSMIFRLPVSKHSRNTSDAYSYRSNVTGLTHVNSVLTQHSDRSRIFVSPEWTADRHPRDPNYNGGAKDPAFETIESLDAELKGTFYHFAIDISANDVELNKKWFQPKTASDEYLRQIRSAFSAKSDVETLKVFDLRELFETNSSRKAKSDSQVIEKWQGFLSAKKSNYVVRMSRDFRKNLTDRLVKMWLDAHVDNHEVRSIVFCDLSVAQAILLTDHLAKVSFRALEKSDTNFSKSRILIVSENLCSTQLQLDLGKERQGVLRFVQGVCPEAQTVAEVCSALKAHDSSAFWKRIQQIAKQSQLLARNVLWHQENQLFLPIYLDYSLAVQDRDIAKIVRRSLRRAISSFPNTRVLAVDELIRPDLDDAQRWHSSENSPSLDGSLFVISSIVTGTTIDSAARYKGKPAAILGCFIVPTMPPTNHESNYFCALDWTPPNQNTTSNATNWQRIPGTPFIRPYVLGENGEVVTLVHPVPRQLAAQPVNLETPPSLRQAYEEWHRSSLLRVGHWSVDRRHGILELDHARALQISAESRSGFYGWLADRMAKFRSKSSRTLIVYPASRLNSILIRHLQKVNNFESKNWQAIPVSFLPDVGDGLKRLAPFTIEHLLTTDAVRTRGQAIFIDIGFVG